MKKNKFFSHLEDIEKSYFEHMWGALITCLQCLQIAGAVFLHGLFPPLFVTTASDKVKIIYNRQNKKD